MKHSRLIRTTALLVYIVPTLAPTFAAENAAPAQRVAASLAGPAIPQDASKEAILQQSPGGAPSQPIVGDLTHLVFTATENLDANLVSPSDGAYGGGTATMMEVSTSAGAGVEISVGGKVVPFTHIGKRSVKKSGETSYVYYGVPLEAGPNRIALTALGAHGLRGKTRTVTIFGAGPVAKLVSVVQGKPVADGRTPMLLRVSGTDQWLNPARPGSIVKLSIVGGDAHFVSRSNARHVASNAQVAPLSAVVAGATPGTVPAATEALASPSCTITAACPSAATPVDGTAPQIAATSSSTTVAGTAMNAPGATVLPESSSAVAPDPAPTPFNAAPSGTTNSGAAGQPDATGNVPLDAGTNYRATGDTISPSQSMDVPLGGNGEALVPIVPGLKPGDVLVRVTDGDVTTEERFYLAPYIRPPMVIGLLTLGTGDVPGIPGEDDTAVNSTDARRARGALFATGAIGANTLATLAYNTSDTLEENSSTGSFVDDPSNRPYQLYGDSSEQRVDALSNDHLYARLDNGRSSVLWGDFLAQTGGTDGIGGFNLLVHGAEGTVAGSNVKITGFQARNDVAYARQVFSPTGLATNSNLLHGDIVVGSDLLTLVSLDRRTGAIVAQNPMVRNVDYVLDNVTGQLRFINIPLPYDENFNPQQIVVTYEYGGVSTDAETTGGRAEIALGANKNVKIGIGFVNDAYGSGNYTLFSQDVSGVLPGGLWTIGHATSKGDMQVATDAFNESVGDGGDAYKLALSMGGGANHVAVGFEDTTAGYDNPFAGLSTPGLLQYNFTYTRKLGSENSLLTVSYDHEQNSTLGFSDSDSNASIHIDENLSKRLSLKAGLDFRQTDESATGAQDLANTSNLFEPTPITTNPIAAEALGGGETVQGELGVAYRPIDPLRIAVSRLTDLSGQGDLSQPEQTAADVSYDFKGKGRAYVRELWSNESQQSFAASTAALTQGAEATRSTAFGFEREVGANTTVDSEYVVDDGANGGDTYSSIGVKERFSFGKNVRGDASYQHANAIGEGLSGFNLYGVTLAYNVPNAMKVTTSYQVRTGDGSGATLAVGAIGALDPSLSLLGSLQDSNAFGISSDDTSVGLAYRPYQNDRSVTLLAYRDIGGTDTVLGSKSEVLSLEELFRPTWRLELAGRVAYKLDGDDYYAAHSSLYGLRATQRIGNRFDVGGEYRYLNVADIAGASFNAFATEGGYRLGDQMRLAVGYNFAGAPDPALAAAPTHRGVYATATSTVDNIFGWGKAH